LDFTDRRAENRFITLPLFHTTGQTVQMNTNLYAGNRVVLLAAFRAENDLETMDRERVNFWVGVRRCIGGF
jgi:long-chain acyl-CoA synthetase